MSAWSPGTEVIARYAFKGSSEDDLPFEKDELMRIISTTKDPNWFRAENREGCEGMIPANYVTKLVTVPASRMTAFYHGAISRDRTERLLNGTTEGSYLVRDSTNFPGDYTLSVMYRRKVEHYRIQRKENHLLTCDDEEFFRTLPELIADFVHERIDCAGFGCKMYETFRWEIPMRLVNDIAIHRDDIQKLFTDCNYYYIGIRAPISLETAKLMKAHVREGIIEHAQEGDENGHQNVAEGHSSGTFEWKCSCGKQFNSYTPLVVHAAGSNTKCSERIRLPKRIELPEGCMDKMKDNNVSEHQLMEFWNSHLSSTYHPAAGDPQSAIHMSGGRQPTLVDQQQSVTQCVQPVTSSGGQYFTNCDINSPYTQQIVPYHQSTNLHQPTNPYYQPTNPYYQPTDPFYVNTNGQYPTNNGKYGGYMNGHEYGNYDYNFNCVHGLFSEMSKANESLDLLNQKMDLCMSKMNSLENTFINQSRSLMNSIAAHRSP